MREDGRWKNEDKPGDPSLHFRPLYICSSGRRRTKVSLSRRDRRQRPTGGGSADARKRRSEDEQSQSRARMDSTLASGSPARM